MQSLRVHLVEFLLNLTVVYYVKNDLTIINKIFKIILKLGELNFDFIDLERSFSDFSEFQGISIL